MRELSLVIGVGLVLWVLVQVLAIPATTTLLTGQMIMVVGGVLGVPLQLIYFACLGVFLRRAGAPAGWYWRSFDHHHLLVGYERWLVLPWFYTGALCMVACLIGIAVTVIGVAALLIQT